jgi:uncharacterized protein YecT (DUF1311 family)
MSRAPALVAGLAVIVGLLSACSGESSSPTAHHRTQPARLAPPRINEGINPLPCPRGRAARGTTLGATACLNQKVLRTDAAINTRARSIFRLLRDRTGRERFLVAEKAWAAYRKASCTSVADVYRGGSARPVALAVCLVRRNRVHLKELTSFDDFLSGVH